MLISPAEESSAQLPPCQLRFPWFSTNSHQRQTHSPAGEGGGRKMAQKWIFKDYWKNASRNLFLEKKLLAFSFVKMVTSVITCCFHFCISTTDRRWLQWPTVVQLLTHSAVNDLTFCVSALTAARWISAPKGGPQLPSEGSVTQCPSACPHKNDGWQLSNCPGCDRPANEPYGTETQTCNNEKYPFHVSIHKQQQVPPKRHWISKCGFILRCLNSLLWFKVRV